MSMLTRAVVAAATVVMLVAGCGAPIGGTNSSGGSGPPSCFMKVSKQPALYHRAKAADVEIRGEVWVICDPTPENHHFTVWLTQEFPADSDVWVPRGADNTSDTPPDASGFGLTATFDGCMPGKWRMAARMQGVSADGTHWGPIDLPQGYSPVTTIKCPGPKG